MIQNILNLISLITSTVIVFWTIFTIFSSDGLDKYKSDDEDYDFL